MGYWSNGYDKQGREMVWGDTPADIVDDALDRIITTFIQEFGRKPTKTEIKRGLRSHIIDVALEMYDDYHAHLDAMEKSRKGI